MLETIKFRRAVFQARPKWSEICISNEVEKLQIGKLLWHMKCP